MQLAIPLHRVAFLERKLRKMHLHLSVNTDLTEYYFLFLKKRFIVCFSVCLDSENFLSKQLKLKSSCNLKALSLQNYEDPRGGKGLRESLMTEQKEKMNRRHFTKL